MDARLEYGENYMELSDLCYYAEEAKRGNPYNTTAALAVRSDGFCGTASCEFDMIELEKFASRLRKLYNFEVDNVLLEDMCYGSQVRFEMNRTGHIEIAGKIYGSAMIHSMEFCFQADQTVLKPFLEEFDELLWKSKGEDTQ